MYTVYTFSYLDTHQEHMLKKKQIKSYHWFVLGLSLKVFNAYLLDSNYVCMILVKNIVVKNDQLRAESKV